MTIIQGDCGGIVFRTDLSEGYFLRVCSDEYYKLILIADPKTSHKLTPPRQNPAIPIGLNQTILIAIVANGSTFTLYVNHQGVDTFMDSNFVSGLIGFAADDKHMQTEVVYSNAKMWRL